MHLPGGVNLVDSPTVWFVCSLDRLLWFVCFALFVDFYAAAFSSS